MKRWLALSTLLLAMTFASVAGQVSGKGEAPGAGELSDAGDSLALVDRHSTTNSEQTAPPQPAHLSLPAPGLLAPYIPLLDLSGSITIDDVLPPAIDHAEHGIPHY